MKIFKLIMIYISVFITMSLIYEYQNVNDILFHTQFPSRFYLHFVGIQCLYGYMYYWIHLHYNEMSTMILTRISFQQFLKRMIYYNVILSIGLLFLNIVLFSIAFQQFSILSILHEIIICMFLSIFILIFQKKEKYNFTSLICLLIGIHLII